MENYLINDISRRQAALIAGYGILFMLVSALFATGADNNDALATIFASPEKVRLNIVGDVLMLVFDVLVALGLYIFLKPVNKSISLLAAWFRLTHVAIYGASIIALLFALDVINGAEINSQIGSQQLKDQIMFLLKGHEYGFRVGLVFFGFHFLILGYLILKSAYVPSIIGILLIIISIAYFSNSFSSILLPNYEDFKSVIQIILLLPAIIIQLIFCIWLLFAGGK